jgi:ferric-dicitrate binding protein FerR (iron transport regulator)/outer membrane protein assembly factor BamD (BamD/ComL family)
MMEARRLAEYVQPRLSEARIDAQWEKIRERDPEPHSGSFVYLYAAAALAVVLGVGFVTGRHFGVTAATEATLIGREFTVERDSKGVSRLSLPEGIDVEIAAGASLQVRSRTARETTLELGRGQAVFDVTHRDGRRVIVATPGFDIEVVGTRFRVQVAEGTPDPTLDPTKTPGTRSAPVTVEVERGTVRVNPSKTGGGTEQPRSVTTGQRWTSTQPSAQAVESADFATSGAPGTVPSATDSLPDVAGKIQPNPSASTAASDSRRETDRASSVESAKELFESAERHRMSGRPSEAAAALDRLRTLYPGDARAALAAFESGRIRMDRLGDPSGAVAAFQAAIRLNPSGTYREDAEARLVQLYQRLGQTDRCRQAKASYLAKYGQGKHGPGRYAGAIKGACER